MHVERNRPRVVPKDFKDFQVQLDLPGGYLNGHLGNISEDGLCVITSVGVDIPDVPKPIQGKVISTRLQEPLMFKGSVAWKSISEMRGAQQLLAGIRFDSSIDLPDIMIALSLSAID